jgi:hypothetical protein
MTTFGFEYEVHRGGDIVLSNLHSVGAVMRNRLCPYHGCGDECCAHDNPNYLFSAQHDCTVSAEFPSKILEWGSERAERAFEVIQFAASAANADLSASSGMHVHVAKPRRSGRARYEREDGSLGFSHRQATTWRLHRLFSRYQDDLMDIARAGRDTVRAYNSPNRARPELWAPDLDGPRGDTPRTPENAYMNGEYLVSGSYLTTERHAETYEFRLWNASKAAWRIRLMVGLSVAMTTAAAEGENVAQDDPRSLLAVLAPYADDTTIADLLRQHALTGVPA